MSLFASTLFGLSLEFGDKSLPIISILLFLGLGVRVSGRIYTSTRKMYFKTFWNTLPYNIRIAVNGLFYTVIGFILVNFFHFMSVLLISGYQYFEGISKYILDFLNIPTDNYIILQLVFFGLIRIVYIFIVGGIINFARFIILLFFPSRRGSRNY